MKYNSTKHIASLFNNFPLVVETKKKSQQLEQIKQLVYNFLPHDLANNCIVANLRSNVLCIMTNSPAWKYKLNFIKMDLLEKLRTSSPILAGISSISIIIDYQYNMLEPYYKSSLAILGYEINKKDSKNFMISKSNALLMNQVVDQEITHEELKNSLKKLISKIQQK